MTVLSVDLAYRHYKDVGVVSMRREGRDVECTLLPIPLSGSPAPATLADYLDVAATQLGVRLLLLDGPQGWKLPDNGLVHCRVCERELNTPAKTGEPGVVKPAGYTAFVEFSIAVFDELAARGWRRLDNVNNPLAPHDRLAIESFPLAAWRTLGLKALPAKAKARPADIEECLLALRGLFSLTLSGAPSHDELQALVAGMAGVAIERDGFASCRTAGLPPVLSDGFWREGFIVCPTPSRESANRLW